MDERWEAALIGRISGSSNGHGLQLVEKERSVELWSKSVVTYVSDVVNCSVGRRRGCGGGVDVKLR